MTPDDVKNYYLTSYNFNKKTGMTHVNYLRWQKMGYVPLRAQLKIQKMTEGELKANIEHLDGYPM